MLLVGVGLGLTLSPTNTDALGRVPDSERSQASGLVQTVRQVGGTLGVAVIGALVLGLGPALPGRTGTAEAIAAGFGAAAAAFAVAVVAGVLLLDAPRRTRKLSTPPSARPGDEAARPGTAEPGAAHP